MNALPWLVLHGAAVWQACLALSVLAGLALASLRSRAAARRAARTARRQLGEPASLRAARRDGRMTLEGRLEATEGPCLRFEDGSAAAAVSGMGASARAGRLLLAVGETRVLLEGPVEVAVGSREAWPGIPLGKLPAAVVHRMGSDGKALPLGEVPVLRSLAAGDRVIVSGVLAQEASDEAPSYREAGKRWTLGGGIVAAFDGSPRVTGPSASVKIPQAMAAGLLFLAASAGAGEISMRRAENELRVYASASAAAPCDSLHAVLVAAATPFRRADALAGLVAALDARRAADPSTLATRAALHELRGERAEAAALWIEQGEPERGARLAEEAKSFSLAARGWYAAGHFERAADAWDRAGHDGGEEDDLRFGVGVQLFAGRFDRAAGAARRLASTLREHSTRNDALRRWYEARAETVSCLASALDARSGDAGAKSRLRTAHAGTVLPGCAVLWIDLLEGQERLQAIGDLPEISREVYDVPAEWLLLLAAEVDGKGTGDTELPFTSAAEVMAIPNGEPVARMVPAVERRLAEKLAQEEPPLARWEHGNQPGGDRSYASKPSFPSWTQTRVTASAAMFAALSGDDAGARRLAQIAEDEFRPLARTRGGVMFGAPSDPAEVVATAALPGDPRPAEDLVTRRSGEFLHGLLDVVVEGDAVPLLRALTVRPPPDEGEKLAWSLAAAGDGEGLARWMRRPLSQPGTFLRMGAHLLRHGRDEVLRSVRWGYRPPAGFRPTEEVIHLSNLAAAAQAIDPAQAEPLRDRARRFREAILKRETAIPLAVLERL